MKSKKSCSWLGLVGCLAISATHLQVSPKVNAQLIPDKTLGSENSVVTPQGVRDFIEGGARRGSNLFHSFLEFNVGNKQQVYFANPDGIANILTRVTGNNVSNIFGILGVDGAANLFLINPNGIIFSAGARLDVAGSFVASTADGIKLGEEGLFSATQPENSRLLAIQPGVLFSNALRQHQAEILNQGNLSVGTRQTLTLHGDTVTSTGSLTALEGTVQVLGDRVSLLNNASIDVSAPTGGGSVLIGNGKQVNIASGVRINADAIPPNSSLASAGNGNGGTVIVKSDEATWFEGYISARGGENSGHGGFVELSGGNLQFSGSVDTSAPFGQVGTLLIDPKNILIQAGSPISGLAISQALFLNDVILQADNDIRSQIASVNQGNFPGAEITINAARSLEIGGIVGNFFPFSSSVVNQVDRGASGNGGQIAVTTPELRVQHGGRIQTQSFGEGSAGNVTLKVDQSILVSGFSPLNAAPRQFGRNLNSRISSENCQYFPI